MANIIVTKKRIASAPLIYGSRKDIIKKLRLDGLQDLASEVDPDGMADIETILKYYVAKRLPRDKMYEVTIFYDEDDHWVHLDEVEMKSDLEKELAGAIEKGRLRKEGSKPPKC